MARRLKVLCIASLIAVTSVFVYFNMWQCCIHPSPAVLGVTSGGSDVPTNVNTENQVSRSYDIAMKRTQKLILDKLTQLSGNRLHGYHAGSTSTNVTQFAGSVSSVHGRVLAQSVAANPHVTPLQRARDEITSWTVGGSSGRLTLADLPSISVDGADCRALFYGDETELRKARDFQVKNPKKAVSPRQIISRASNCSKFVSDRHYALHPVNVEEVEFSIAFSILLFTDVEQFERLLRAIYRPQNLYCIHVDNKSSEDVHKAVHSIAHCFENVFVLQHSFIVEWGTFSVLQPELACMKRLLKWSKKWKYLINLTGQEFPLKTNWQIVQILKAFNGANNMEGTIERRNLERFEDMPPAPHRINITKGSVHIVAVRGFVEYIIKNRTAADFLDWVKDTYIPDETFFSSLNHNPRLHVPGSYLGHPETDNHRNRFLARFKNWGDGPFNWPCHGQRVSNVCIFGVGDLHRLASRPELFANKFYLDYEPLALDCMESLHYQRLRDEIRAGSAAQFDTSLYAQQKFVRNHW